MHRRHLRWLIPSATAAVATAVAIVLVTQVGGSAACAASGSASYYSTGGNGMCNLGAPATDAYAAVGRAEYAGGKACGTWLDVTGPAGTTRVQVVDLCPSCPAGKIDLSKASFTRIGSLSAGIIPVTYSTSANPQPAAPLKVKLKGGTGHSSLTAVVDNHYNPLSTVELQTAAGFAPMQHGQDNLWTAPAGPVTPPVTLRITDVYGHQALVGGLTLGPAGFQQSTVVLYGPPSPSPEASSTADASPTAAPAQTVVQAQPTHTVC